MNLIQYLTSKKAPHELSERSAADAWIELKYRYQEIETRDQVLRFLTDRCNRARIESTPTKASMSTLWTAWEERVRMPLQQEILAIWASRLKSNWFWRSLGDRCV